MTKFFLFLATLILANASFAFPAHTGFCRFGEECDGIVSDNIYEAQRICRREVFDKIAKAVYQEQKDGSIVFIGYVCVAEPN